MNNPVRLKLLSSTPELLELSIRDRQVFRTHPLVVTNKAELLGPLPLPRDFIERLFGGAEGYRTIAGPEKVDVRVLNSRFHESEMHLPAVRTGPLILRPTEQQELSKILLDFESYQWGALKLCSPDYGVKARFTRAQSVVEILFCFECDILEIQTAGKTYTENFNFNHNKLVKLMRRIFPDDEKVQKLEHKDNEKDDHERFIQLWKAQPTGDGP